MPAHVVWPVWVFVAWTQAGIEERHASFLNAEGVFYD